MLRLMYFLLDKSLNCFRVFSSCLSWNNLIEIKNNLIEIKKKYLQNYTEKQRIHILKNWCQNYLKNDKANLVLIFSYFATICFWRSLFSRNSTYIKCYLILIFFIECLLLEQFYSCYWMLKNPDRTFLNSKCTDKCGYKYM